MIEIAMPAGYYSWSYGNSSCCIPTETKTVTAGTSATTVTPTNYNTSSQYVKFLKSVTVNPTPSQEKTITASRSAQTVTPDSGKLLSKVTVNKYPDASGTYTVLSGADGLDMGATNNYRYVNAKSLWNSAYNSRLKNLWTNTSPNAGFSTKTITIANSYNFSDFQYIFIRFKLTTSLTQYEDIIGINMSNYTKYTISVTNIGSISNVIASAVINGSHTVWRPIVYLNSKQLTVERPVVNTGKSDGSVYMQYQTSGLHHDYVIPLELYAVGTAV